MKRIIVITGTPGVGKTTLVKALKSSLNASAYNATDIVNKFKLYSGKDKFGAKIVKMKQLQDRIAKIIRSDKSQIIILDGHILCDIKVRGAKAIVVREHLKKIIYRLQERKYPDEKIKENVTSEALDYCGASAAYNYSEVYEIMNGKSALKEAISIINGKKRGTKEINLLEELVAIIKKDHRFAV
ncbi:MAG: AAA family ATPase [Candidatus Micrarchaeota archaeon]|nr:AAA family ATPase [Candidatus Micrarchaeota archaeon]